MQQYQFCFAWCWPYDRDFVDLLEQTCRKRGVSFFQVTTEIIEPVIAALEQEELSFSVFFDRASDMDEHFNPLADWATRANLFYINRFWLARRAWDKAAMHHQLTRSGLDAPYTVILPAFQESPELPEVDLTPLGATFAIKPAHGGGGAGVLVGATSWEQVQTTRQQFPADQYLLQTQVQPVLWGDRPAWFRLIYCLGQIYSCWWNPTTHIYTPITPEEEADYGLPILNEIGERIARLSRLELFSTEVACTADGRFPVVDYINDPIDLRLQSRVAQGVPDPIAISIADSLAVFAAGQARAG
jgi:hypothetical protein